VHYRCGYIIDYVKERVNNDTERLNGKTNTRSLKSFVRYDANRYLSNVSIIRVVITDQETLIDYFVKVIGQIM